MEGFSLYALIVSFLRVAAGAVIAGTASPLFVQFFKKFVFTKVKSFLGKWVISVVFTGIAGLFAAYFTGVFAIWTASPSDYALLTTALAGTWGICQILWKTTFEKYFSTPVETLEQITTRRIVGTKENRK